MHARERAAARKIVGETLLDMARRIYADGEMSINLSPYRLTVSIASEDGRHIETDSRLWGKPLPNAQERAERGLPPIGQPPQEASDA